MQIIDEISPLSGIDYDGLTGDFGLLSRIYNAVLSIEKDGLEEWKKHADFPDPDGLGCLYQKLKERMKEEGYICFDEQIQLTNQLFSEYPDVLKSYQQRFRYVMIDEFQDISSDQVDLVYASHPMEILWLWETMIRVFIPGAEEATITCFIFRRCGATVKS
mgnify:FL=1